MSVDMVANYYVDMKEHKKCIRDTNGSCRLYGVVLCVVMCVFCVCVYVRVV